MFTLLLVSLKFDEPVLSQASVGITVWSARRRVINPVIGVMREAQRDALQ